MTARGHRPRYDVVCDKESPITTATVVDYALGLRGRVCDLPSNYLDALEEALLVAHPSTIHRRTLTYLLVSGRFRRSRHPLLRDLTPETALTLLRELHGDYRERVRAARAAAGVTRETHRVSQFKSFKSLRRVIRYKKK